MTRPGAGRAARYRLYIDESGDHTYRLLDDPAHRYLALLGVWFRQDDAYVHFAGALEGLKREVFGPRPDKPVVLHRSEIVNRKGPFGLLRDAERSARFDEGLLEVVANAQFRVVCVVIDKLEHMRSQTDPFHPYHYCLAALLDRYCGWLAHYSAVGDAMAESRGREEDLQLGQAYRRAYESGTLLLPHGLYQRVLTTHDIKIQPKRANIPGLQLADLLAHPVRQACLAERGAVGGVGPVFGGRLVSLLEGKFHAHQGTREVWGHGKVWLPRK